MRLRNSCTPAPGGFGHCLRVEFVEPIRRDHSGRVGHVHSSRTISSTVVKDGVSVLADGAGDGGVLLAPDGSNVTTVAMSISSTVATLIVSAAAILSFRRGLANISRRVHSGRIRLCPL